MTIPKVGGLLAASFVAVLAGCAGNAVLGPLDGAADSADVSADRADLGADANGDGSLDAMTDAGGDSTADAPDAIANDADDTGGDAIVVADAIDVVPPLDVTGDAIIGTDVTIGTDVAGDTIIGTDVPSVDVVGVDAATDGGPCSTPTRSCYSGPGGTQGVGACRAGAQFCLNGSFTSCSGEVTPNREACNGVDDDCNGTVDDALGTTTCGTGACRTTVAACTAGLPTACVPGLPMVETCNGIDDDCDGAIDEDGCACVHVAPLGLDTNPGTGLLPMRTIAAAIARAAMPGSTPIVCVAAGATCLATADYPEAITMANGVSVYGGYQALGATWPRLPACVTRIVDPNAVGVVFPATVTSPTILDGFTVQGHSDPANAAITVNGSTGAIVNNDIVIGGAGTTSVGIDVVSTSATVATPLITRDAVSGGTGSALSIGIRSVGSAPVIQNNCATVDAAGRCTSGGCGNTVTSFIRARTLGSSGTASTGIRLENSPNALVDSNGICTTGTSTTEARAIHVAGNATGTIIRRNNIGGFGGQVLAAGIGLDACAGASPRIENNTAILASSSVATGFAQGIRAVGDCHPVIDGNLRIVGGAEGSAADCTGIACLRDMASGASSRCVVTNNVEIQGSGSGFPPRSVGVHCDVGACGRIEENTHITGRGGVIAIGLLLDVTGPLVNANRIDAGCATTEGTGVFSRDSFARVQNNVITGTICSAGAAGSGASFGVRIGLTDTINELDLHSNDIYGGGQPVACTSEGIAFDTLLTMPAPTGPRGIVRNNIVYAGTCNTNFDVSENNAAADPRIFENNDLWFTTASVTALYRNENVNNLNTIAAVNALADITSSMNLSADPQVNATFHIPATSPARNTGTMAGAPATDFENDARPREGAFDIGADEFRP